MFKLLHTDGRARRELLNSHGAIQTPVFMNVGTRAAIKGGLDSADLENIGCQIELSNAYHLHLRPGEDIIKSLAGFTAYELGQARTYRQRRLSGFLLRHCAKSLRKASPFHRI